MATETGTLKVRLGRFNVVSPGEFRRFLMGNAEKYGWDWNEDRGFWDSYFVITGPSRSLEVLADTLEGY